MSNMTSTVRVRPDVSSCVWCIKNDMRYTEKEIIALATHRLADEGHDANVSFERFEMIGNRPTESRDGLLCLTARVVIDRRVEGDAHVEKRVRVISKYPDELFVSTPEEPHRDVDLIVSWLDGLAVMTNEMVERARTDPDFFD